MASSPDRLQMLQGLVLFVLVVGSASDTCNPPTGCRVTFKAVTCDFTATGDRVQRCYVPSPERDTSAIAGIGGGGLGNDLGLNLVATTKTVTSTTVSTVTVSTVTVSTVTTKTDTSVTGTKTSFIQTGAVTPTFTSITGTDTTVTTATGTSVTGSTETATTTTTVPQTPAPFDPCSFIAVPAGCKCSPEGETGFFAGADGTVDLQFIFVALPGQECIVDGTASGPTSGADASTTAPSQDISQCIDNCCCQSNVTECSHAATVENCDQATKAGTAVAASCTMDMTICVGQELVVVVEPVPEDDCDDDTTVIIIVIVFALLLLFVICVALYFCLSKKDPVDLSSSADNADCDPAVQY